MTTDGSVLPDRPDPADPEGQNTARPQHRGPVERYVESITARVGGESFVGKVLHKVFPNHFSFLWGEVALYSFVVLVVTGIYLTLFFEGSQQVLVYEGSYAPLRGVEVSAAYDSVLRISFDVKGGLLIRQTHHWAALVFVGAIALHMARVFFTGAFRRPRELNWVVGLVLLILALAAGFTGYSLPDDLLSGTGLRITQAIILALPFIGERLTYLLFGGEWPGTDIIGRLYPVHILIIPGLIVALLGPAHGAGVASEAHPVHRAGTDRAQRRRRAGVAGVRHQVDRVAVPHRRSGDGDGVPVPRQRGVAVRPLQHGGGDVVLPARLVHRVPRGVPAPVPPVGDAGVRVHDQQRRVLRRDHPGDHLRWAVPRAVDRAALHP